MWRLGLEGAFGARPLGGAVTAAATAARALDGKGSAGHYARAGIIGLRMNTLGTLLYIWLCGRLTGRDEYGNRYYRMRGGWRAGRERRWVLYAGEPEASKVPAVWHAWLHHTTDTPPGESDLRPYPWVKPHQPNPTGTAAAYRPKGHVFSDRRRPPGTGDYEPWRPK